MITVKKDAIRIKNSEGNMQSAGVLCNVGTFGINLLGYARSFNNGFLDSTFDEPTDLDIFIGEYVENIMYNGYANLCRNCRNVRSLKIRCKATSDGKLELAQLCSSIALETVLKTVDLSGLNAKISTIYNAFRYRQGLESIIGELDLSECINVNYAFSICDSLKEIRFKPNTIKLNIQFERSSLLSDASIQSIIDGLADLTGQTAQTITLHNDVKSKLTETQIETITSKNWTLA